MSTIWIVMTSKMETELRTANMLLKWNYTQIFSRLYLPKSRFPVSTTASAVNLNHTHTHTHTLCRAIFFLHPVFFCFVCGQPVSHLASPQLEVLAFVVTVVGPQQ